MQNLHISENEVNIRLDVFLADRFPSFSRARIQKLIAMRAVTINGEPAKSNYRTRAGDDVSYLEVPAIRPLREGGSREYSARYRL